MQYKAFISYSHQSDARLAPALQSALRRIGKPWYRLPDRLFRDEAVLGPGPLKARIEEALSQSEFLILLASPDAAASPWVTLELQWWLANRSVDRLIIVLTGGVIEWDDEGQDFDWTQTTALSPAIREKIAQEPVYVDMRWARDEKILSLRQTRFRDAVLDIGSALRGVPRDALDDNDVRQARQARRLATAAVAGLVALTVAATIAAYFERVARNEAVCRQLATKSLSQLDQRLDLALLIAVEGVGIYKCPEVSSALLAAVHHQPRLVSFLSMPQTKESMEIGGTNMTTDVAFSPDGRLLAATSWHAAQVWDAATRQPAGPPLEARYGIAFAPDGKTVIAADGSESIRFWDSATGTEAGDPIRHGSLVMGLALSPDGTLLASTVEPPDSLVHLWDVASRGPSGVALPGLGHAFSPSGKTLATAAEDFKSIVLWDVGTRKPRARPLEGHTGTIRALAFSPDETLLASGGVDHLVIVWDLETRTPHRLTGHVAPVNDLAFSHDGRLLASVGGDGRVILWDARELRPTGEALSAGSAPLFGVAFDRTDRLLASTGGDARVLLWSMATDPQLGRSYAIPRASSSNVAFSRDGRTVAFIDSYASIILWDLKAEKSTARFGERATAVDFSPDGQHLAAVSRDGVLSVWDVSSSQPVGTRFELGDERFWGVRFSDDGRQIAIGGDAVVLLWDVPTQTPVLPFRHEQKDRIWSLAFGDKGKTLIAGGNKSLRFWNLDGTWTSEDAPMTTSLIGLSRANVALSPDGALLAFRDGDQGVAIWDVARRRPARQRLTRSRSLVSSLAFSPDGQLLAVGAGDGSITLWDVETGEPLGRPLFGHGEDDVDAIAFGPDGRTLVSIGAEKMVIWDFSAEAWVRAGCRMANRNLTQEEWTRHLGSVAYEPTCRF